MLSNSVIVLRKLTILLNEKSTFAHLLVHHNKSVSTIRMCANFSASTPVFALV